MSNTPNTDCYIYATNYIYRYPKTEKELKSQLMYKGFNSKDVVETIDFLKIKGYIDDKKYASMYVNSEIISKGKPIISVQNKLYQKGISKDIIQEVLRNDNEDMIEGTINSIKKQIEKYKRNDISGFDIIQKLLRKGYKLNDVKRAIEENKK